LTAAQSRAATALLVHEIPNELRDPIRRRVKREVTRIEHVDFGAST